MANLAWTQDRGEQCQARVPFRSVADVRLWWRNATTRSAIHHRAVMSYAVYPVKWIQSTLGGNVTDWQRGEERVRERDGRAERMRIAGPENIVARDKRVARGSTLSTGWRDRGESRRREQRDDTVIMLRASGDSVILISPTAIERYSRPDKSLCAARLIFKLPFGKLPPIPEMKPWPPVTSGGDPFSRLLETHVTSSAQTSLWKCRSCQDHLEFSTSCLLLFEESRNSIRLSEKRSFYSYFPASYVAWKLA